MMPDLIRRWRWPSLIAMLLVAGLVFAFWPKSIPVDTGKVTRGPMAVGITDDGVTRAKELYIVSAPVTGYLSRIELEAGDLVSRGKQITLMTGRPSHPLDPRSQQELRAALAAARASESGIGASLAQSRRDLYRAEQLASRGFLPRSQLEVARTSVSTGQASLAHARAEIARIQAQVSAPTGAAADAAVAVRAPASGSVLSVITESAGVIAEGTPLMTIGDPRRIEVVVDLLSREAVRVKPGDKVIITQWGGNSPLTGRVERIEPFGRLKISALGIEEQRVNVIIGFDAANALLAARLGHGYQVDATIVLWSRPDAVRVPIGALFRGGDGGWRVFVVDAGRARERVVKIGHVNEEFGEVLEGLTQDTRIILNPGNALTDGTRVKPR
jgi:HlyD family secretion protein